MNADLGVMKACNAGDITKEEIDKLDGLVATTEELNTFLLFSRIPDVSTAASAALVVSPVAGILSKIYTVLEGAIATADAILTASVDGGTNITQTVTIAYDGSAEGDMDSCTPADNNVVAVGSVIKLVTNNASINAEGAPCVFVITLT